MPTVLHVRTVTGHGGGPEKTLLTSPAFIGEGYCLKLAFIRPNNDPAYDLPARARERGVNLIDLPECCAVDPKTWWTLSREIRNCKPALLHAHDYKSNVLSVVLGWRFGIPVLTTLHGYVTRGGRLEFYYWLDRWALRRMDHVIAVSEDLFDNALALGVPKSRCTLIRNAIDTDLFNRAYTTTEAKRRLGLSPSRQLIGAVGRLSEEKGFHLLIEAAGRLVAQGAEIDVCILGEGPARPSLERQIADRGLHERIRLLGHKTNTLDWYQAMDVFVLSSLREGLPNVLLEAMALKTAVVATRVAGVPRVVVDGVNGLLVEAGDASALAAVAGDLLRDEALRARLSARGRETIEEQFNFRARMLKVRAIYDGVLQRSARNEHLAEAGQPSLASEK